MLLHHLAPLAELLGAVVGDSDVVTYTVRKLRLDRLLPVAHAVSRNRRKTAAEYTRRLFVSEAHSMRACPNGSAWPELHIGNRSWRRDGDSNPG